MAETIFEAGVAGYKSGIDAQQYKEQSTAQTSLLSSRAAQAKLAVTEQQDAYRTTMATRAAQSKAQIDNLQIDSTTLQGIDQIYDKSIEATKTQPEVQEALRAKKMANLSAMAEKSTQQTKMISEQVQQKYDVVREALINPEIGAGDIAALGQKTGDRQMIGLARVLSGEMPVPGLNKPYAQLSEPERQDFNNKIRTALAPKGEQASHDIQMEIMNASKVREQMQRDDEKKQNDSSVTALNREKMEQSKELKNAKLSLDAQTLEIKKLDQIAKLEKTKAAVPEIANPKYQKYNPLNNEPKTIPNAAIIGSLQARIDKLQGAVSNADAPKAAPAVGTIEKGHRFLGGDPKDKANWVAQ